MSRFRTFDTRVTAAATMATALAALSLTPVIEGWTWYAATVGTVIAVGLAGALLRAIRWTRSIVLVVLTPVAQGAVVIIIAMALVARSEFWGVLPTTDALDVLRTVVRDGLAISSVSPPPVPSSPAIIALTVVGVGLVAIVVDVIAVTLMSPAVAGLPLLAMYLVPVSVLPDGAPWWSFIPGAVGWLLLMATEASERAREWGPDVTDSARWLGRGATARRAGLVALTLAVLVPLIVPGLTEPLLGPGGSGGIGPGVGGVSVNPLASLKRDYLDAGDREVLTVSTSPENSPDLYLRLVTLDQFDGTAWSPTPMAPDPAFDLRTDPLLPVDGLIGQDSRPQRTYSIQVGTLDGPYLPVPMPPVSTTIGAGWYFDPRSGTVFSSTQSSRGTQYEAAAINGTLTRRQMRERAQTWANDEAPALAVAQAPASIQGLAQRVTAGSTNSFDAAVALQRWFRTEFRYSTDVRSGSDSSYLEQFLTERVGYCEQFAAAMALMANAVGIPARVAVGFAPGEPVGEGTWSVSARDAHAWPELWIPGVGWTRFEPTPRADSGTNITTPVYTDAVDDAEPTPTPSSESTSSTRPTTPARPAVDDQEASGSGTGADGGSGMPLILLLLVALGIVLSIPSVVRAMRRRRRETTPAGAWADLRDSVADYGRTWSPAETPRQTAARLSRSLPADAGEALNRLRADVEADCYGRTGQSRETRSVSHDLRTVRKGLAYRMTRGERVKAQVMPASVLRRSASVSTARRGDDSSDLRHGS